MDLECKLVEKAFTDDTGSSRKYYVLEFNLADGSTLEVTIKSDKAKLLRLSHDISSKKMPDVDWLKD